MTEHRPNLKHRLYTVLIAGVGGTAAAGVSLAMAIYDAAHPDPVLTVAANETVDTGRWLVTIRDAYTGNIPPTGTKPLEPKRFVMVVLDLDNRSAATSSAFHDLITIAEPEVEGLPKPTYYLARDKWIAGAVNPNMPERLIAAWEWPQHKPLPEGLRLSVKSQIFKPRDNLYGAPGWFDRGTTAIVALPVDQRDEPQ
ncbi:hypothetical protein [Mesorhizobium sp. RMAD-H1]|uniref:hypothetical protein n=1 Tax=Mesorhizobium sp. RMAD-H1 TaxID=2587065 RepID=UPI00161F18D8|nr:hypothetical protein [Mesorhizobium sp. RMAD-H1]MBB2974220.1 hypothetical protein [Mesorhizobium sp. RMAD-H1]